MGRSDHRSVMTIAHTPAHLSKLERGSTWALQGARRHRTVNGTGRPTAQDGQQHRTANGTVRPTAQGDRRHRTRPEPAQCSPRAHRNAASWLLDVAALHAFVVYADHQLVALSLAWTRMASAGSTRHRAGAERRQQAVQYLRDSRARAINTITT